MIHCCILLDFLCELYYDARIHEHQISPHYLVNDTILGETLLNKVVSFDFLYSFV